MDSRAQGLNGRVRDPADCIVADPSVRDEIRLEYLAEATSTEKFKQVSLVIYSDVVNRGV